VIPLVIGFFFLEPYFSDLAESYSNIRGLISNF